MNRNELIKLIGENYLKSNIEGGEFSYKKAIKEKNITYLEDLDQNHFKLDLRFQYQNLSILIETKTNKNFHNIDSKKQLMSYYKWERKLWPNNNIIAILFNIENSLNFRIWKYDISNLEIFEPIEILNPKIKKISEWFIEFNNKTNNKSLVIKNTIELNKILHKFGIKESIRSQFVGSTLIVLNSDKFDLEAKIHDCISSKELLKKMKERLSTLLDDNNNKTEKIKIIFKILDEQQLLGLKYENLCTIFQFIQTKIRPFINEKTNLGEDLLNLFFTTFNKYVLKEDKNQSFTPSHITEFMCEVVNVNKHSKILDPTCGSGAFLVQAMAKMLQDANDNDINIKNNIKQNQLFGIEIEEKAFGLASTNMLMHEDGKSNIVLDSLFNRATWIKEKNINIILMNPPFNGKNLPNNAPISGKIGEDATKGLYFVNYVANVVNNGLLATILPLSTAIGSNKEIMKYKQKMLNKHTLKAVFSLPNEIFYPGASASACIMIFELNKPHNSKIPTFFGYYKNDGFIKKKNSGRIEKENWFDTKNKWLKAYKNQQEIDGFSVLQSVNYSNEWLAEAYMKTDYSNLTEDDFIKTLRDFIGFRVKEGL